jgi:adenylate cyclase
MLRVPTVDDTQFAGLASWIAEAGLSGQSETELLTELCARLLALGMPLARVNVFIDTLHPIYVGYSYVWQAATAEAEIGQEMRGGDRRRRRPAASAASTNEYRYRPQLNDEQVARWQRSTFFRLIETGDAVLRRHLTAESGAEFPVLGDLYSSGMTDYVAIVDRFGADAVIGDMDCVYSSWITDVAAGFDDADVAGLRRLTPFLALAIKSAMLVRIARTLVETYLGRDPARRVLQGSITQGASASLEAVLWFSDLHDYTRISDRARPDQIIPLLDDYADVTISAIYEQGGDVLKLVGDGTLAIFAAEDRGNACRAALTAARTALKRVDELKQRRLASDLPATDLYLGLHVGEVTYGNFGSRERLDFTVVGPAVNEVNRIAAMCRLVDQPILISSAFAAAIGPERDRLVSVGRYALRGVGRPEDLFTLDGAFAPETRDEI